MSPPDARRCCISISISSVIRLRNAFALQLIVTPLFIIKRNHFLTCTTGTMFVPICKFVAGLLV